MGTVAEPGAGYLKPLGTPFSSAERLGTFHVALTGGGGVTCWEHAAQACTQ